MKKKSMPPLKQLYLETVKDQLRNDWGYINPHQVPSITKVVISMGTAKQQDKHAVEGCTRDLMMLSGQKPILTKAKKSISNFKLREGQTVGLKVTLRGDRMYHFVYKLFHIVCPTISDFRGFKMKCDGRGSYSLGIDDHQVFPEVNPDKANYTQGMNVTFVTTAKTNEECVALLTQLGCPFKTKKT